MFLAAPQRDPPQAYRLEAICQARKPDYACAGTVTVYPPASVGSRTMVKFRFSKVGVSKDSYSFQYSRRPESAFLTCL